MTLAAGRLNKRVTLQSPATVQDEDGAATTAWTAVDTVWAGISPLSVNGFIAADQRQSKVTTSIVLRYRSDLQADWRIVHGSTIYQIVGKLPDKDSGIEYITLACSEGVNQSWE